MSKYPRQDSGYFGLDSTTFLWSIIGAILLAGGFFLFGMYYGYQQGYQAAKSSLSDENEEPRQVARRDKEETQPPAQEPSESGEPQPAITEDQLSGTNENTSDGFQNQDSSSERVTDGPPSSYTSDATQSGTPDQSVETSEQEDESSAQQERPDALNVTRLDTAEESTAPSGQQAESESTAPSGETSNDTTSEESSESEQANAIEAEGPVYTIQAVSFLKQERAAREVQELESQGYQASITEKMINGRKWYRVRVGKYTDRTEADNAAQGMIDEGIIEDYWISKVEK